MSDEMSDQISGEWRVNNRQNNISMIVLKLNM